MDKRWLEEALKENKTTLAKREQAFELLEKSSMEAAAMPVG